MYVTNYITIMYLMSNFMVCINTLNRILTQHLEEYRSQSKNVSMHIFHRNVIKIFSGNFKNKTGVNLYGMCM